MSTSPNEVCFWRRSINGKDYAIEWYRREGVCGGDVGWEEEGVEDLRNRLGFGRRNVCGVKVRECVAKDKDRPTCRDMIIFAIDNGIGLS